MGSPVSSATCYSTVSSGVGQTRRLAGVIARALRADDVVVLSGELGAGKTVMVQAIAEVFGVDERVTSPTFAIHRTYSGDIDIHHLDVYRLGESMDIETVGLNEIVDGGGLVLVEWGERVAGQLPVDRLEIVLRYGEHDDERCIDVWLRGSDWRQRGPALFASLDGASRESTVDDPC